MTAECGREPARSRLCLRDDRGSILPLVVGYAALALALVLVGSAASSLYLEKKRLLVVADGAALVGAESFDLSGVSRGPDGVHPQLSAAEVRAAVASYLAGDPAPQVDGLALDEATTVDGLSATVTVSALWRPPVVTVFVPEGIRVTATSSARAVFG